jgi:putative oxidoreductase
MQSNPFPLSTQGLGIFFLRLFSGIRLIYGTADNVISWQQMLHFRDFLASLHFPLPLVAAVISVYAQFLAGLLFIVGWKIRWAAAAMLINFFIASMIHVSQGFEAMTPALALFFMSLLFLLEGPGRFSLTRQNPYSKNKWD